jgi:hypothetical protein
MVEEGKGKGMEVDKSKLQIYSSFERREKGAETKIIDNKAIVVEYTDSDRVKWTIAAQFPEPQEESVLFVLRIAIEELIKETLMD